MGLLVLVPLFCVYVLQSTAVARKLRAQLIENQTKDDFVAIVSHELRTPLATISNVLSNALAGVWGDLSDEARAESSRPAKPTRRGWETWSVTYWTCRRFEPDASPLKSRRSTCPD
jgi:signal transduction histidine kinase